MDCSKFKSLINKYKQNKNKLFKITKDTIYNGNKNGKEKYIDNFPMISTITNDVNLWNDKYSKDLIEKFMDFIPRKYKNGECIVFGGSIIRKLFDKYLVTDNKDEIFDIDVAFINLEEKDVIFLVKKMEVELCELYTKLTFSQNYHITYIGYTYNIIFPQEKFSVQFVLSYNKSIKSFLSYIDIPCTEIFMNHTKNIYGTMSTKYSLSNMVIWIEPKVFSFSSLKRFFKYMLYGFKILLPNVNLLKINKIKIPYDLHIKKILNSHLYISSDYIKYGLKDKSHSYDKHEKRMCDIFKENIFSLESYSYEYKRIFDEAYTKKVKCINNKVFNTLLKINKYALEAYDFIINKDLTYSDIKFLHHAINSQDISVIFEIKNQTKIMCLIDLFIENIHYMNMRLIVYGELNIKDICNNIFEKLFIMGTDEFRYKNSQMSRLVSNLMKHSYIYNHPFYVKFEKSKNLYEIYLSLLYSPLIVDKDCQPDKIKLISKLESYIKILKKLPDDLIELILKFTIEPPINMLIKNDDTFILNFRIYNFIIK